MTDWTQHRYRQPPELSINARGDLLDMRGIGDDQKRSKVWLAWNSTHWKEHKAVDQVNKDNIMNFVYLCENYAKDRAGIFPILKEYSQRHGFCFRKKENGQIEMIAKYAEVMDLLPHATLKG